MAYSAIPTITTGDVATASWGNTYLKDNFAAGVPDIFTTDGDMAVGTGDNAAERVSVMNASNLVKHEVGGIEADISAATTGDTIVGQSSGVLGLETAMTQGQAEGGTDTQVRGITAQRLSQSIAALGVVPSGIIAFMAGSCPTGWSEYTAARGRYVVGLPSGGTQEGTAGTALSNQENRTVGQHTHTFSGSALATHNHTQDAHLHTQSTWSNAGVGSVFARGVSGNQADQSTASTTATNQAITAGTPAGTNANTGSVASTNAPYIQLTCCEKD
jgi:hypothetical protein